MIKLFIKPHAETEKDPRFNGMADCVGIPQQFDKPKAFQLNASRSVGFFNAHPLNQASLFRGFALKKPLTFVRGFVARPGFEPGTSGL